MKLMDKLDLLERKEAELRMLNEQLDLKKNGLLQADYSQSRVDEADDALNDDYQHNMSDDFGD